MSITLIYKIVYVELTRHRYGRRRYCCWQRRDTRCARPLWWTLTDENIRITVADATVHAWS